MIFPELSLKLGAILKFRVELLDRGFGARPLRRNVAGRRDEETKDGLAHVAFLRG
jgi:hypothetical protein